MATRGKKPDDGGGFVGRLAERGEEAVTKLVDELGRNPRVTDALDKAMSAKGKVDAGARRTLSQIGLAAADELKDLRKQIERLERRLARLEGGGSTSTRARTRTRPTAKRSETKKKPTTRKRTTTAKKDTEKAASPAPGRSIGGGPGRGSSPGGGSAAA
jgi:polyhydroxyalkanoate synthesis regulator phasin